MEDLYYDYKRHIEAGKISEIWLRRLWTKIEEQKPRNNADLSEIAQLRLELQEMRVKGRRPALLDSTFSQVFHDSEPYSSTKSDVVMESLNDTVPAIPKPFSIDSIKFEKEREFVSQLADKIRSNITVNRQKLYLHVTQDKKFSGFSRKPDMVLTLRSTLPTSASEIVVWIELKITESEYEVKGQLISGLSRLRREVQSRREEFYGAIINTTHVKLLKYTPSENEDPVLVWSDNIAWGSPDVKQDDALKTLLRLINTPAELLGFRQTNYPSEIIVPTVHSPAFVSNSLVLYDLRVHRSAQKRPDIIQVCIERSDIHTSKEKKRPTEGSDVLEGVMKVGNSHCKHEIIRERQALSLLNPSTRNRNKYDEDRQKLAFIPELLGFGTLLTDDHEYNITAPFGTQLEEITSIDLFDRVLVDINQALRTAHEKKIFHADVSVKNIILTRDNAVLIDWGFAFIADQQKLSRGFTGTPLFASIRITGLLNAAENVEYGKKLPWSKASSLNELINQKNAAMTVNWQDTLSRASLMFHKRLEQMHKILFTVENVYDPTVDVKTLLDESSQEVQKPALDVTRA